MKHLSDCMNASLNEVQIAHAVDSGDFIPADEKYKGSWLDFWKGHVSDSIKAKFLKGIKDPVGAHVIDKDCKVYIMPCEKDENLEEGQMGAQKSKKLFLSVPKDALVEITENDSEGKEINSISWSEFIKRNKSFSLLMQDMKESDFQKRW